jgi:hypothetical protein
MNLNQIGLFPSVIQKINSNQDVKDFVCSSAYFSDLVDKLNDFLQPVMNSTHARRVQQRYVGRYVEVPYNCSGKPFLIFAPLTPLITNPKNGTVTGGIAFVHSRIAYLPLFENAHSIHILFPNTIINPQCLNKVRTEPYRFNNDFDHYVIPNNVNDFIQNPQDFLLMDEIKKRINQ